MDWREIAGIISGCGAVFAVIPYVVATIKRNIRPSIITWSGVGVISAIAFAAQMMAEPSWSAILAGASCLYCPVIVAAAWRGGDHRITRLDIACVVVGAIAVVAWRVTAVPEAALALSAAADLVLCIPMLRKVAKDPTSEPVGPFFIATAAALVSVAAARKADPVSLTWPIYFVLLNGTIVLLASRGRLSRASLTRQTGAQHQVLSTLQRASRRSRLERSNAAAGPRQREFRRCRLMEVTT